MMRAPPPWSEEAEQAVLGSILLDNSVATDLRDQLDPVDFFRESHRHILRAMFDLIDRGDDAHLATVAERMRELGTLEGAGSVPYLVGLAENVQTAFYAPQYIRTVQERARQRDLIATAQRIVMDAQQLEAPTDIIERAETQLLALQRGVGRTTSTLDMGTIMGMVHDELARDPAEATGILTDWNALNDMTNGLQPGQLIIVAGRPSMGKTAAALQMAGAAAKRGHDTLLFSLEMSALELGTRFLSVNAAVDAQRLKKKALNDRDMQRSADAAGRMSTWPLHVIDQPDMTITQLRSEARRHALAHPDLGLVVVDYMQLISGEGEGNRQQEITTISRGMKLMARELGVPVICLSQLSRQVEQRADKRPILSDLRESGAIEQDADIVMFLYRDDYYDPNSDSAGLAEFILAKHRNGPVGTVEMMWLPAHTAFRTLDTRS